MPCRVLFMISSMRGGGSEQQTLLLLKHLDRSRFQPHLFLLDGDGSWMSEIPVDVAVHICNELQPDGLYFPGRVLRHQTNQLKNLIREHSIDVVYDRTFHMSLIAGPACDAFTIPRVSTIVSPPDQALPAVESRFVELKRRRLAKAYRLARAVVAVSHVAAESARGYYRLPSEQVSVIHNGVDVESLIRAASLATPPESERLTLVCVGRMTEEKGQRDLITAVASLPDEHRSLRLWIIGDGPQRTDLEQQAGQTCGRHEVRFFGAVDNPAPYIAAADALVLPSRFEGMPNVVLEAMALETPVIATRAGGTVELEREQPTVLWCGAGDAQSLAVAIEAFGADPSSAQQRASAAKQLVAEHHDITRITARVESLLAPQS